MAGENERVTTTVRDLTGHEPRTIEEFLHENRELFRSGTSRCARSPVRVCENVSAAKQTADVSRGCADIGVCGAGELRMADFKPAATSGGNRLQVALVGADHEVAAAQSAFNYARVDYVAGSSSCC
jgi:hypothetical protein